MQPAVENPTNAQQHQINVVAKMGYIPAVAHSGELPFIKLFLWAARTLRISQS
jgi:hypothetical protein